MAKKGKFIVIEGTDGSGKATQADRLVIYLRGRGHKVHLIDFPRYYDSFHGETISRYLNGEFGDVYDVNPYLASLTYALDRMTAKEELSHWLNSGDDVIANRYTLSNMAFQAVKLPPSQRDEFIDWEEKMEYKVHKIPKEDLIIFLHLPTEYSQRLIRRKPKRAYTKKTRDIHERNLTYMREVEKQYMALYERYRHIRKINCLDKSNYIRPIEDIHKEIINLLKEEKML